MLLSRLEELLEELCPNGVEYKSIGEIALDIYRGSGITRDQVTETGKACVRYGEIYTTYGLWFDECVSHTNENEIANKKYFEYGDILFAITGEKVEEIAKSSAYIGHEKCLAGGDIVVLKHEQNPKFLAYALSTVDAQKQKSKGKVKSKVVHSSVPAIKEITVPVPPLEVQNEIVHILDSFAEHIAELKTELIAEITARKKQYEFYYNSLMMMDINVPIKKLGEVCTVQAGGTPSRGKKEYWDGGTIKWLGSTVCQNKKSVDSVTEHITEYGFQKSSAKLMKKNTTLIALVGATIGKIAYLPFDATINQNIAGVYPNKAEEIDPDYVYYACKMLYPQFLGISQGKLAMANLSFVRSLEIPVPSLIKQKRIIEILDRFDKLCCDISESLPAEIKARQKQFEYYRDKLLTFKELGA